MVAFAYMANNELYGWHVRLNYWGVNEVNSSKYVIHDFGWPDLAYAGFPRGLPTLDIGPPGANHGAITWMQARSNEWSNCTICYADSHDGWISYYHVHPDSDWNGSNIYSALPSICVHDYSGTGDYRSSISFLLSRDSVSMSWNPAYMWIDTHETSGQVTATGQEATLIDGGSGVGKWDSGAIIEHNFGMSTALTLLDNNYWMIWSGFNPTDLSQGGPCSIYGAWGNTN